MPQTLHYIFKPQPHMRARYALAPLRHYTLLHSLEALLAALRQYIDAARKDLLSPRRQVIDRILREAALI